MPEMIDASVSIRMRSLETKVFVFSFQIDIYLFRVAVGRACSDLNDFCRKYLGEFPDHHSLLKQNTFRMRLNRKASRTELLRLSRHIFTDRSPRSRHLQVATDRLRTAEITFSSVLVSAILILV